MADRMDTLTAALADRYRIERELGQGGMATVYLAEDLKHHRQVAVKVLRPELAAALGAERFLNEIAISARLDHPHILTLIDSGEARPGPLEGSPSFVYYVLPFVRGESLRDRLTRVKQLGLEEALAITRQVAGALDYAHREGVIHRDIKPENILLREGEAMLADFGLALAVREAGGNRLTETGLSMGTPQYMSPEQATGDRQLDQRTDVYSLAAVLYEMLAGEPPHSGPTVQAVIAKLITERPTDLTVVREGVPPPVAAAVAKALSKAPADRFASAGAFAAALLPPAERARSVSVRPGSSIGLLLAAAILVAALVFGGSRLLRPTTPELRLGRSAQLTTDPGLEIQPALSPDGKLVAYAAGNPSRMRLFIRPVGGGRTIPLSDDSTAVESQPRWSPDGSSLIFLTRGGVSLSPAFGGTSRPIVAPSATASVASASWSPDGRQIVFVRGDSLLATTVDGALPHLLTTGRALHSCMWSPDGRWITCVALNDEAVRTGNTFGNLAPSAIVLVPAAGGRLDTLVEPRAFNQSPVWGPGAQLLFVSNRDGPRDVYAIALTASGRPRGEPARLTTGLGAISISLSADGRRLAYAVYTARANIWSLPIPAGGSVTAQRATPLTSGSQVIEAIRVTRNGGWLLYDSDLRGNADIYRIPVGGGPPEQLTSDPVDEFAPDLSPDGRFLVYHSWRSGTRDIEVKPLDGSPVQRVTDTPAQESYPVWSPDGTAILFYDQIVPFRAYITRRNPGEGWSPPTLLAESSFGCEWSPDGRWVAYVETPSAAAPGPLAVVPSAGGEARRLFEPASGIELADQVMWSPDGLTLYYKSHDARGQASFWAVRASGGRPRRLVRFTDPERQSNRKDFAVDQRRFYFAIEDRQSDVFVAEVLER